MLVSNVLKSTVDRSSFRFMSFSIVGKNPVNSSEKARRPPDQKSMKEAFSYCADLVRKRDYENYLALMLMPKDKQPRILASLALNVEVSTIRQKIKRNSGVTGIYQLQFWKDALNALYGDAKGPIPRQPVVTALHGFGKSSDLDLFQKLVAARQETLGDRPFESIKKLEENGRNVHGTMIKLIGSGLDDKADPRFLEAADYMGAGVGVVTLVRATVPLLKEGVVLLPTDLMEIHGLNGDRVYNNKNPEALKALMKDLIDVADSNVQKAREKMTDIPVSLRQAFLSSGVKTDYLVKLLRKNNFNLFEERIQKPHPLISWQLWWRNMRKIF